MPTDVDFENLLKDTTSKLRKLRVVDDEGLRQSVILRKVLEEAKKILAGQDDTRNEEQASNSEPQDPQASSSGARSTRLRQMSEKERDLLRYKLERSEIIKEYLDYIVYGEHNPKKINRLIARFSGLHKKRRIQKLRHQMFVFVIPKRALFQGNLEDDSEESEEDGDRTVTRINFRSNCLKRRLTLLDLEEICISKDKLRIYRRSRHRQPNKFLPRLL